MKLENGLYAYLWRDPYENNCNTYVIDGDKKILIDPGHARHLNRVIHQMERDGLSVEKIDVVLVTHSHPDHMEGVEFFLEKPVRVAMGKEEERYLLESGRILYDMMQIALPKIRVDFYLKEGDLRLGNQSFHIYQTPGHSPGSLTLYWPERKVLFTGDVVFFGGIGRTDFLEGNSKQLMESIERLSRLETELLLPGHGDVVMGKELVFQNYEFIRHNFYPYL